MNPRRVTQRTRLLTAGASALAMALFALPAAGAPTQSAAASADATDYVALGDSFSAGTGTRASTDDCYRSPYGYPALVANAQGLDLDYQACSGATIADVRNNQVAALGTDTDYVTMTIGGNDLNFADVITSCALPGWLSNCNGQINNSLDILRTTLPGRYDALFADVEQRAPHADVVVGSYPRLFNGRDCNWGTFFSGTEMSRLNSASDELAGTIEQRTAAAGFDYVDPRGAFTGHAVCDSVEWVNGLSWPIIESFHPNRAGNIAYAEIFWPGSTTASLSTMSVTGGESISHAQEVRAQADAVLAMELTSRANLAQARADGVSTGQILRLVGQLRSDNIDVVERALAGLTALDEEHAARARS